ncbi:MAG: hypothetical protein AAGC88_11195, partial [Bacteroidota bacterium]
MNFGNQGSSSLSGTGHRILLLSESSIDDVTTVPVRVDGSPWIEHSWESEGTGGQSIVVGQVWAVFTREGNYAIMEIIAVGAGTFEFDYKYQPNGSRSFDSNFFEDFASDIPASWGTNDASWQDNPSLGFEGEQG